MNPAFFKKSIKASAASYFEDFFALATNPFFDRSDCKALSPSYVFAKRLACSSKSM